MKLFILVILFSAFLQATDSPIPPAMNAFTANTYKRLAGGDGNLILSPFNIATALSMLLSGARGQTAYEIQSVLHLHSDSAYDAALGSLVSDLDKAGNTGGNELHTANGLWVQRGLDIQAAFQRTLAEDFHASLTPLDFITHPEAARSQINGWTEEHTKERIKNLLPPGSVDARTRLVLTSAIYFYGKWQNPFVTSRTQPAPFTSQTGAIMQTGFMNQTLHSGYTETDAAQILELPYAGTGIAFDVLLPKAPAGLPDLEKSLTVEKLTGWFGALANRNVQVSLPKFRVEAEFSLSTTLSAMGMPTAFTHQADFSGIEPKRTLEVAGVFHKAFVDVSEQGTEAAAATGITMRPMAARRPEQAVVFRADHPFIFLIRDTRTGIILFVGRLMEPR